MGFAAIHAAELVTFVSTVHCSYGCPLIPNVLEYVLQRMSWSCTDPCAVLMDDLLEVLALAHQTVTQYPFLPRNLDRVSSCWKNTDSWLVCSTAKKLSLCNKYCVSKHVRLSFSIWLLGKQLRHKRKEAGQIFLLLFHLLPVPCCTRRLRLTYHWPFALKEGCLKGFAVAFLQTLTGHLPLLAH